MFRKDKDMWTSHMTIFVRFNKISQIDSNEEIILLHLSSRYRRCNRLQVKDNSCHDKSRDPWHRRMTRKSFSVHLQLLNFGSVMQRGFCIARPNRDRSYISYPDKLRSRRSSLEAGTPLLHNWEGSLFTSHISLPRVVKVKPSLFSFGFQFPKYQPVLVGWLVLKFLFLTIHHPSTDSIRKIIIL